MKKIISLIITLFVFSATFSQDFSLNKDKGFKEPVTWTTHVEKINDTEYYLVFKAKIKDKWHLYSQYNVEGASLPLEFSSEQADSLFTIKGKALESKTHKAYSETWKKEETFFSKEGTLKQKIKLLKNDVTKVRMSLFGQVCKEACILVSGDFDFDLTKAIEVTKMNTESAQISSSKKSNIVKPKEKKDRGLLTLFLLSFFAGFAALLTPCVFPMIPMTVSFFTKQSKSKAQGIRNAIIYGLSIIVLYVLLGSVVVWAFGADSLNILAANPWFNIAFFLLLLIFAISFLGAFEIILPSSWANKMDSKADKGGVIGIIFMALALAVVSFSCTGPIVGTALVAAATKGGIAPIISMFGFSLAIALPFALFAAFPGWLNSLPKSGGWLNTVKVVLGFLELGLAFKFLSNADLVWDTHWLEREMFIAIWIAIFGTMAFYLFGKIKLPHDSPLTHISVGRLLLGILTLTFVIYLIPGLWGAPLKLISGFPPPMHYSESPYGIGFSKREGGILQEKLPEGAVYGPHDIASFEDYDQGLAYAKKVGKPILLDFTGKACVNCRKMEEQVWSDPKILQILKNDIVLISLYVDLVKPLPKEEQYISETTGKKIRTYGNKWSDFQMKKYKANAQPYYVLINHNEENLNLYTSYNPDIDKYYNWLKEGIGNFKK
ncbi:MAG: thioredoxin family protein [Flavobacteriaceae bacterium]|nr:thioredoxin family protein [Flavobacteriaceae bacterium]